jgi:hypothetical protein
VKKAVSRGIRLPRWSDGWTARIAVLFVAGLLLCLFTLTPESAKNQALAQEYDTSDTTTTTTTAVDPASEPLWPGTLSTLPTAPSTTTTEGETTETTAGGETTTTLAEETTTTTEPAAVSVDVDVVVYGTQTSGLAAIHELALGAPHLRVALISAGNLFETPLVQGLSVEDARDAESVVGGFYAEWRQTVIRYYALMGKRAFTTSGRFVYEPEVAASVMKSFVSTAGNVLFYSAKLLAAGDTGDKRYVDVQAEGFGRTRLNTRYFIDASVEGDLARMLGASYRIGRDETVYNDVTGQKPAYPTAANNYVTAPQRFSALLTLQVYPWGRAPKISSLVHPNYNPSTYAGTVFAWKNVASFSSSWSMKIATLPNNKRELNENWTDWPDIGLSYQWVFEPDKRGEIRKRVLEWTINRVRYIQEHGYSQVGIATIPQKLYVREGPRIVCRDTYTVSDLVAGAMRNSVAMGCYVQYDRHDAFYPNHVETTRYVHLPMEALMVAGHPNLLVSTAVSTDYQAYSSAVRMELTRANMGAAAAMVVIAADNQKVAPGDAPYQMVRTLLYNRGYRVE